ncbi:MAG: polysaccharide deacetylase family protein [Deltaproteobacteria bacterium]|nr:polysaccharide deacetylase family protein [Deltaproteobacteria bacterium]
MRCDHNGLSRGSAPCRRCSREACPDCGHFPKSGERFCSLYCKELYYASLSAKTNCARAVKAAKAAARATAELSKHSLRLGAALVTFTSRTFLSAIFSAVMLSMLVPAIALKAAAFTLRVAFSICYGLIYTAAEVVAYYLRQIYITLARRLPKLIGDVAVFFAIRILYGLRVAYYILTLFARSFEVLIPAAKRRGASFFKAAREALRLAAEVFTYICLALFKTAIEVVLYASWLAVQLYTIATRRAAIEIRAVILPFRDIAFRENLTPLVIMVTAALLCIAVAAYHSKHPLTRERLAMQSYTPDNIDYGKPDMRLRPLPEEPKPIAIPEEPKPVPVIERQAYVSIPKTEVTYTVIEKKPEPVIIPAPPAATTLPPPVIAPLPVAKPLPPVVAPLPPVATLPQPTKYPSPPDVTRGSMRVTEVSITFDGGSDDSGAEAILDTLKSRGIKTTIFLTGGFIRNYPGTVKRMVAEGHEIGNHTMTHPHLTAYEKTSKHTTLSGVTRDILQKELLSTAALFHKVTGTDMSPLWRAPYGEVNPEIRAWAYEAGFVHIGWTTDSSRKESLDSLDWVSDKGSRLYRTTSEIKNRLLGFGKETHGLNGGIILMHLGTTRKEDRVHDSLGDIIDGLTTKGYVFVKISEMLPSIEQIKPFYTEDKLYAMKKSAIAAR